MTIDVERETAVVSTRHGQVRGFCDRGTWAFLGIPYAAPPLGAMRLREAAAPRPWSRVLNATSFGPTAPKGDYPARFARHFPEVKITGDDFLNLNVWTPEPRPAGLPVLVFVHGGSFAYGASANAEYRGSAFARDGVVFVSVNYRLGSEGFLHLEDGTSNLGLLDLVAALEWVRDNIEAFGGDPAKVTVAGHSAGGTAVATLLGMPRAAGLFRAAIPMGGAAHHVIPPELGTKVTRFVADELGVQPTAAALRAAPLAESVQAASRLCHLMVEAPDPAVWGKLAQDVLPFEPTVDGEVLPRPPLESIADGMSGDVAVMVGCNAEEARTFLVPTGDIDAVDDPALEELAAGYGLDPDRLAVYRAAHPDATPGDLAALVITDWFYRVPAIRLAEAQVAAGGDAWLYTFAWFSDGTGGRMGAAHGVELPFVFDTTDIENARPRIGDAPPPEVAAAAHSTWVRFVTDADPGWDRYDADARTTGVIEHGVTAVEDFGGAERAAWDGCR
jgi:para-nitrobenzyl esterase